MNKQTVSIPASAAACAQLDEPTCNPRVERTSVRRGRGSSWLISGPEDALEELADDFEYRGKSGREGFDHTGAERAACRIAASRIRSFLGRMS